MAARLEKLELLARHYLIDDLEGIARYLVLSLCLATDFVPGFWDVYSHETPRGRGRPKALAPHVLLNLVEGLKGLLNDKGMATKDAEACAIIAKLLDPRLSRPSQKTALARRARTLANRLGPARRIHEK
jgi:hypothetical protein